MSLELAAMRWLWIEQKCLVVLEQRTPCYGVGQPDVIGITPGRFVTEIEIKRSASDFRADFKKPHRINRQYFPSGHPRLFYYMMPSDLGGKLIGEIPEWAGLLKAEENHPYAEVVKRSPINKESKKLSIKQCTRLARMMTAHVMGYAIANNSIKQAWRNECYFDHSEWIDAENGTWMI